MKRLLACLGLLAACLAQDPIFVVKDFNLSQILDKDFTPQRLAVLGDDRFVLVDQNSNELVLISDGEIIRRTGGFGQSGESFTEPVDVIAHNLQIWVCDRYENSVKLFDHKLNFLGVNNIDFNENNSFLPDFIAPDPFGNILVLSRQYGQLLSLDNPFQSIIDLNQYGMDGSCISDLKTDNAGNIALLNCENKITIFNRFGRKSKTSIINIKDPIQILTWLNNWVAINSKGEMESIDGHIEVLPIRENETVVDTDVYFKYIILLTDQRILVLKY